MSLEPRGETRDDLRMARICASIYRTQVKDPRKVKEEDFIFKWEQVKKLSPQETAKKVSQNLRAFFARWKKK